jgi:hypothetical protein
MYKYIVVLTNNILVGNNNEFLKMTENKCFNYTTNITIAYDYPTNEYAPNKFNEIETWFAAVAREARHQ